MQEHIWEREYKNPRLVTGGDEPQSSVKEFIRFLRKKHDMDIRDGNLRILDLGSGTGKNANFFAAANPTNTVSGLEISKTAIATAAERAKSLCLSNVDYRYGSIGKIFPFPDQSFDIILDVTSSNSLSESERAVYLQECARVISPHGHMFVRALCKDGDTNAKELLRLHPGPERDTYIMPDLGLTERIWTRQDFTDTYSPFFTIEYLDKETHYTTVADRRYKRHFWLAYLSHKQS